MAGRGAVANGRFVRAIACHSLKLHEYNNTYVGAGEKFTEN
jgi:hypothetical protein